MCDGAPRRTERAARLQFIKRECGRNWWLRNGRSAPRILPRDFGAGMAPAEENMAQKRKRRYSSEAYKKRRRIVYRNRAILIAGLAVLIGIAVWGIVRKLFDGKEEGWPESAQEQQSVEWRGAPALDVQLLTPNEYSRPQTSLEKIDGIVIHYTANPGTGAQANRNYFEGLKDSHETKASSHFVVGLDGEVIQCIPSSEISYASNDRNGDTLSIECCHPDETGQFNDATYGSVVQLTAWLCVRFGLDETDVIRHYDVTGKLCPKYYVEHEEAWERFREDVRNKMQEIEKLQQE